MANDQQASAPNGLITRVSAVASIVRDVGFPVVMVGIFVGWAAGWIPLRPLDSMATTIEHHDSRVASIEQQRVQTDKQITEAIGRFVLLAEKIERRDRLSYCVTMFKDADLRRQCLQ